MRGGGSLRILVPQIASINISSSIPDIFLGMYMTGGKEERRKEEGCVEGREGG